MGLLRVLGILVVAIMLAGLLLEVIILAALVALLRGEVAAIHRVVVAVVATPDPAPDPAHLPDPDPANRGTVTILMVQPGVPAIPDRVTSRVQTPVMAVTIPVVVMAGGGAS